MKKFLKKVSKSFHAGEKGFTLIELLIVIVILGILAAVAIPQVTKFIRNGKVSAGNSELALVNTAMGALMADAQITTLDSTSTSGPDSISGLECGLVSGTSTNITITAPNGATGTSLVTYLLSSYITGGVTALKGDYTFDASGVVTTATYPGTTGFTTTPGGSFK